MKRGFLSKDLTRNVEFIVNLPGVTRGPEQKVPFHITNDSLTFNVFFFILLIIPFIENS